MQHQTKFVQRNQKKIHVVESCYAYTKTSKVDTEYKIIRIDKDAY